MSDHSWIFSGNEQWAIETRAGPAAGWAVLRRRTGRAVLKRPAAYGESMLAFHMVISV